MKAPRPTRPTLPVLAKGKTDTGRLWIYLRDNQPFGGAGPPAAIFHYSRNQRGEHPQAHLAGYAGILQADAYDGYNELSLADRKPAPIREAACWEDPATRATSAGRRCLRMSAGGGRMSGPRIRDRPSRRRERKMQRFKSARSA